LGTGYVRQDVTNSIANGEIVDAADLNAEWDAVESAFSTTGHTHDGTTAEGGPVEVIGPVQDFIATAALFRPKTDDTYDLGSATYEFKDIYIDGVGYLDAVDIDGGNIDSTIIGATTPAAGTFTTLTSTGTGTFASLVSSSVNIDGGTIDATVIGATTKAAGSFTTVTASGIISTTGGAELDGSTVNAEFVNVSQNIDVDGVGVFASVNIDGGTIDSTVIGGTTKAAGGFTTITTTSTGTFGSTVKVSSATPKLTLYETDQSKGFFIQQSGGSLGLGFSDSVDVGTGSFLIATRANDYELSSLVVRIPAATSTNGDVISLTSAGATLLMTAGNTTASAANLFINSSSGLLQRSTSSGEYKINRLPLEDASEVIDGLEPISFESTHEEDSNRRFVGFIAEDVAELIPEASVDEGQNYDVRAIVAYLTQEIKNLRTRVAELENGGS